MTTPLFLLKNVQKVQKVIIFFIWRGEELRGWGWQIWIARWLNFCQQFFIFPDFCHLQEVNWPQSWTKRPNFGYLQFRSKFGIFKDSSNTHFVSFSTTSGKNFSKISLYLGELGHKKTQNGSFHGCCIATKIFEILLLDNHKWYKDETYHDFTSL